MPALRISIEGSADPGTVFGPQGGTLGRAEQNTLVLDDAERSVSRLHARVEWRATGFAFINMGLNAVVHNGALLATADEAPLAAGDVLRIGRFSLLVSDAGEHELPLDEDDALFDDMTGEPLPPRAAAWPDIALFDDSAAGLMSTANAAQAGSTPALLGELLHGLGCAAPPLPATLTPRQAGQWMRSAIEDTLRTWIPHCSPAVQQAWFTSFEQALIRVSEAEARIGQREG
ncbi:FHA domain-containing protein [Pseudorhodoferax sp.]|uniref:FHA domain-containing protein n=1 Tax=Pseudorhodoferax sp. TaxID=1993553 RepID=UPI002DD687AA|nr:FHA domain-containing protein [Pseudorhodoferax sp.]